SRSCEKSGNLQIPSNMRCASCNRHLKVHAAIPFRAGTQVKVGDLWWSRVAAISASLQWLLRTLNLSAPKGESPQATRAILPSRRLLLHWESNSAGFAG